MKSKFLIHLKNKSTGQPRIVIIDAESANQAFAMACRKFGGTEENFIFRSSIEYPAERQDD